MIFAYFQVLFTHKCFNLIGNSIDSKRGKVHGVRTHICDITLLIKSLCHHHSLRNGKSEFASSFLLERGSGERWSRRFGSRFDIHIRDSVFRPHTVFYKL